MDGHRHLVLQRPRDGRHATVELVLSGRLHVLERLVEDEEAGLQIGSDTLIGTGKRSGSNWTLTITTKGLKPGAYTYYAVATDSPVSSVTT